MYFNKAQSAMEYLMTYGWAILVVLISLGALFALGVFDPDSSVVSGVEGPFSYEVKLGEGAVLVALTGAGIGTATVNSIDVGSIHCIPVDNILSVGEQKIVKCLDMGIDPDTNNDVKVNIAYSSMHSSITHNLEINAQPGKEQIKDIGDFFLDDPSLIAYYKLDGDAIDATGNNENYNDGTLNNGVNCNQPGKVNTACKFDASLLQSITTHFNQFSKPFSLSFWLNPTSFSASWKKGVFTSENYLNSGFRSGLDTTGDVGKFSFWTTQSGGSISLKSLDPLPLDEWTHVVIIIDNSISKIYVNGNFNAESSGLYVDTNAETQIARVQSGGDLYLDGSMDEIMIFNKVLSEDEIEVIYENTN